MKKMKKFASLLMAVAMIFSMMSTSFAVAGDNDNSGKITVTGTVAGQTYTPYQLLVLESYDTASGAFSYKAHSAWEAWLKTQTTYVSVSDEGYVTWVGSADPAAFALAAMKHIETVNGDADAANDIAYAQAGKTSSADNEEVVFEGLNLGYYLIDSTLGALCALNTTRPEAVVDEKNYETTIDKKVNAGLTNIEKPAGYDYVENVTKQIGTIVDFAVKVDIYPGATNYVYHDSMGEGLTYINTAEYPTQVWSYPMSDPSADVLNSSYYTVNTAPTCEHDGKKCDFTITFSQDFLDTVEKHEQITIRYFAELNEKAVTYHEDADGNVNYAKLTYGGNSETEWDPAKVYTFSFELVKDDTNNNVLTGAHFKLYDAATGGNLIPLVYAGKKSFNELDEHGNKVLDGDNNEVMIELDVYRPATAAQIAAKKAADDTWTTDEIVVGRAVIEGIPLGKTYYLEETVAPNGYNILTNRVSVLLTQSSATNQVLVNGSSDHMAVVLNNVYKSGGVEVENRAGTLLPTTGGIGTTIFYVSGAALALGAIVLFITKRRMEV